MSVFLFARIAFELSYDSCFREADKLYLIKNTWIIDGKPGPEAEVVIHAVPGTIAELYPDRVTGATVMPAVSLTNDYRIGERQVKLGTLMGDTLFFSVMGLDVLRGNPQEYRIEGHTSNASCNLPSDSCPIQNTEANKLLSACTSNGKIHVDFV